MKTSENIAILADDSRIITGSLSKLLSERFGLQCRTASSLKAVQALIDTCGSSVKCVVSGFVLKDAPYGEVPHLAIERGIPTVILTSTTETQAISEIARRQAIGYVLKQQECLEQVLSFLAPVLNPTLREVLVADDSGMHRSLQRELLKQLHLYVHEAPDGAAALEIAKAHPGIRLVITDNEMPKMNGLELVSELRKLKTADELGIIGVSATGNRELPVQFLKRGATDFLHIPFSAEEYHCRVLQNLEMLERIEQIKSAAQRDFLTGLRNRTGFFKDVEDAFRQPQKALLIADLDEFKRINDTYGHSGGDAALRHVGGLVKARFGDRHITARFGGEEFCVLLLGVTPAEAEHLAEEFRRDVGTTASQSEAGEILCTTSVGLDTRVTGTLAESLHCADLLLYQAKGAGRNRVASNTQ